MCVHIGKLQVEGASVISFTHSVAREKATSQQNEITTTLHRISLTNSPQNITSVCIVGVETENDDSPRAVANMWRGETGHRRKGDFAPNMFRDTAGV